MPPKPFFLLNPVLETLIFSSNPVLSRKKPFKPYPYKPNCVYSFCCKLMALDFSLDNIKQLLL